jgi:hypothetical protein
MKLTLADISDTREYERGREAFREYIISLKARRRVSVDSIITFVFENVETVKFQIQEMARVEKISTDEGIQHELDTYNVLLPQKNQLSATMFLELTTEPALREWLPKLVGIESAPYFLLSDGSRASAIVEESHAERLTREDITSTVHYVRFAFTEHQVALFLQGSVSLGIDHQHLQALHELSVRKANRKERSFARTISSLDFWCISPRWVWAFQHGLPIMRHVSPRGDAKYLSRRGHRGITCSFSSRNRSGMVRSRCL